MIKLYKICAYLLLLFGFTNLTLAKENFFIEGVKLFDAQRYDDAKFLFERNIVFNPKDAKSYLYLAKIYHEEDNEKEKEKNLNTVLLLEPTNEDAMFMLIDIELDKSNFSEVKELKQNFEKVCIKLCNKVKYIEDSLKDIEPKNES